MKVLVFGAARDIVGNKEFSISLDKRTTVASFRVELFDKFPLLKDLNALAFAVNEEYATDDLELSNQDVLALIPPVSGG